MSWLDNKKKELEKDSAKEQQDLELSSVKEKLSKLDTLESQVGELSSKAKTLDDMAAFLAEHRAAKAEAARKQAEARAKESEEAVDFVLDPEAAVNAKLQPLIANQVNTTSLLMRQEIFSNSEFEYYTGDFKKAVDQYIDSLPLQSRADPRSIKNCYNVVLGEHFKEIQEGKMKSRFAQASASATGTGAPKTGSEEVITLSEDEKKAAKMFGMDEKEYFQKRKEVNYV